MPNIIIDFNDYEDIKDIYKLLNSKLNFPDYFSYNLDSLYDILGDIEDYTEIVIKNKDKYEKLYDVFLDASLINENIKIFSS